VTNNEFHLAALPAEQQATLPTATPLDELGAVMAAPAPKATAPIPERTRWWKTAAVLVGVAGLAYYLGLERGRRKG
jgi:ferric-dicitrate binding protein FerR (iron transport regulator)